MSFDEVVSSRRSIRKYLSLDISDDVIEEIIKCGILAPSAHNRQPWKIVVLRGEVKDLVASSLMDKSYIDSSICNTANVMKEAPVLVVIFYDCAGGSRDNDMLSLGAFIENMHLKATELGLGALWVANTNYVKNEISEICNVELECISCLAIGKKGQEPKMRPRKSFEEIIVK